MVSFGGKIFVEENGLVIDSLSFIGHAAQLHVVGLSGELSLSIEIGGGEDDGRDIPGFRVFLSEGARGPAQLVDGILMNQRTIAVFALNEIGLGLVNGNQINTAIFFAEHAAMVDDKAAVDDLEIGADETFIFRADFSQMRLIEYRGRHGETFFRRIIVA